MSTDAQALQRLAEFGRSVWVDHLSRELLEGDERIDRPNKRRLLNVAGARR